MKRYLILLYWLLTIKVIAQEVPKGKIVFTRTDNDGRTGIYIMDGDGSHEKFLIKGNVPTVSPDGKYVAYIVPRKSDETGDIYVANIEKRTGKKLASTLGCFPIWSPTGDQIAFEYFKHGIDEIYLVDCQGKNVKKLVGHARNATWSPDGRFIAFSRSSSDTTADYDIYTIELKNKKIRRITNTPGIGEKFSAWSPDGREIACVAFDINAIEVIQLSTGKINKITDGLPSHICWTPNGKLLYEASSDNTFQTGIGVIDPITKSHRLISTAGHDHFWPNWINIE
ncbi:MAG: PD40 domain-containing protein [Bacteroidetes bacterium]|nr:PD40 domain-containing protein [Bacteroidota bacterium]